MTAPTNPEDWPVEPVNEPTVEPSDESNDPIDSPPADPDPQGSTASQTTADGQPKSS